MSAGKDNDELVDNLCKEGYIVTPEVEKVHTYVHTYVCMYVRTYVHTRHWCSEGGSYRNSTSFCHASISKLIFGQSKDHN